MLKIKIKDLIIYGIIVVLVFIFALEMFKIKHQMKFATYMEQQNQNTTWIRNFSQSLANAQQQAIQQQQPKPKEIPEKKEKK